MIPDNNKWRHVQSSHTLTTYTLIHTYIHTRTHLRTPSHLYTQLTYAAHAFFNDGGNKRGEKSDRSIGLERLLEEAIL